MFCSGKTKNGFEAVSTALPWNGAIKKIPLPVRDFFNPTLIYRLLIRARAIKVLKEIALRIEHQHVALIFIEALSIGF
jgi:hypothetical protein